MKQGFLFIAGVVLVAVAVIWTLGAITAGSQIPITPSLAGDTMHLEYLGRDWWHTTRGTTEQRHSWFVTGSIKIIGMNRPRPPRPGVEWEMMVYSPATPNGVRIDFASEQAAFKFVDEILKTSHTPTEGVSREQSIIGSPDPGPADVSGD